MTNEIAKECLQFLADQFSQEGRKPFDVAISALNKQIPKKPIHDSFYYYCPICNGIVYKGRGCANNECRQKIDWSEDND